MSAFILPLILMGALYAFMILPQQRRMKAHKALMSSLEQGDMVVTNSGIFGAIAEVEDTIIWLEVAPEVELKISRSAIAERLTDDDHEDADTDDADDADVMAEFDADDSDSDSDSDS